MKRILITGCAGFIGSHTTEAILNKGYEVIGLDNFSKFYDKGVKLDNLSKFKDHPNFSFHEMDIRDKDNLFIKLTESVDLVIHLAAKAGVRPSIENPEAYIDVNLKGSQHILQWMKETGCKKLFFASSSSVYGNNDSGEALKEEKYDVAPISPYAFTKRAAELMNHSYHHLYDIDIINARFFTVYGPRQRPDLAIHKFVNLIESDETIDMYGDGSTARDYTFVEDTVNGILSGVEYLFSNDDVFETINLGNQNPVKLIDLINMIYEVTGKEPKINQIEMQDGDVNITYANIEKAKSLLGYLPQIEMKEGLSRFLTWYKDKQ
jgi:nucleoside-diphosphate-sugar epimerase